MVKCQYDSLYGSNGGLSDQTGLLNHVTSKLFMPQNHTSDNISEALRHGFNKWYHYEKKLACITTDNGANIVAAVNKLNRPWLNCFCHNLHLAETNAIASANDRTVPAMGLWHSLVSMFPQSWLKRRDATKAQVELQIPQHGLILVSYESRLLGLL